MKFFRHANGYGRGGLKQRERIDPRRLLLKDFRTANAPAASVMPSNWLTGYGVGALGNDRYGCCVYAAIAHFINTIRLRNKDSRIITAEMVLKEYGKWTGFLPDRPETDNGAFLLDAIKQWASGEGLYGTTIDAFVEVEMGNHDEVTYAVSTLNGVIGAYGMPTMDFSDEVWDVPKGGYEPGKGPWSVGGHAMFTVDASPGRTAEITWGGRQSTTPAWRKECSTEGYAVVFREALQDGRNIAGLDLDGLLAAVQKVRE